MCRSRSRGSPIPDRAISSKAVSVRDEFPVTTTLWRNARLTTLSGASPWGLIEQGALVVEGERISWVGPESQIRAGIAVDQEHDLAGAVVTPGLIDCHTHLVYGGDRSHEFELRLGGASYEQIARAGGGIRSTVAATRAAGEQTLFE